jgi:hypothetical protein
MMERLLAKMDVNWQDTRNTREEVRAGQELLKEEMLVKMETNHERVIVKIDSRLEEMEVCLGRTETMDLETNRDEIVQSVA